MSWFTGEDGFPLEQVMPEMLAASKGGVRRQCTLKSGAQQTGVTVTGKAVRQALPRRVHRGTRAGLRMFVTPWHLRGVRRGRIGDANCKESQGPRKCQKLPRGWGWALG